MRKTIGYQTQNSNYQTFGYRILNHYQLSSFAVCVHGRGNKDERRRATGRNVLGGGGEYGGRRETGKVVEWNKVEESTVSCKNTKTSERKCRREGTCSDRRGKG
jgi:hypothetical protein